MPPQKRTSAKAKDEVTVEPASAAKPRSSTRPTKAETAAALEQSAAYLEEQAAPPTDVHPKPTTPSKAEVEAAVSQATENLETQGVRVAPDLAVAADAAPVSAGGATPGLDALPVSGARDKSQDASPTFVPPITTNPTE